MSLQKKTALVSMIIYIMVTAVKAAPTMNVSSLPGKPLTDMGKKFNIPHLQLTGEVINHLAHDLRVEMAEICRLHPCSLWTAWSGCNFNEPGKYGQYGASNRSRNCGFNTTLCERYGDRNMENEHKICKCKDGYLATKHGYCLKFFNIGLEHNKAKGECHKEGGYLANSGSAKKMQDMNAIKRIPSTSPFWVDGFRASSRGKWTYENSPEDLSFSDWYSGRLSSSACKGHYYAGKWYMRDFSCHTKMPYMCEILI